MRQYLIKNSKISIFVKLILLSTTFILSNQPSYAVDNKKELNPSNADTKNLLFKINQSTMPSTSIKETLKKNAQEMMKNEEITSIAFGVYINGDSYIGHYGELNRSKGNPHLEQFSIQNNLVFDKINQIYLAQTILLIFK